LIFSAIASFSACVFATSFIPSFSVLPISARF
jgi:hypothetical protein